ncbi:MAG: SurA N-terminal domain-containing protein [Prevotella sp.]|nr:SurA N-terminal domain-containing protein [Prevotella sp.]
MAALGKIRSKGIILICVIGFALFAFVAEEMFRSCDSTRAERSQRLGEVMGEKINAQDYQKYVEEFVECMKMDGQQASDEQLRDAAWEYYVQEKIITKEAEKLGLAVTDEEIQDIMTQGTSPLLVNIPIPDFHNQQTGRFDINAYKQFMNSYEQARMANPQIEQVYKYLLFKERQLRSSVLMQKYQTLLAACVISNPVDAEFNFNAEKVESDVQLAYIDYRSVEDKDVKISDADLQKKYDEMKPAFQLSQEVRAIKYIQVKKVASDADRDNLYKSLQKAAAEIDSAGIENTVRKYQSLTSYLGVPVSKSAFSADMFAVIDSMPVGAVKGPVESKTDNSFNVVKLLSKTTLPDSIQYRIIATNGKSLDEAKTKADSILKAIQGGADFDEIAKKYEQTPEKVWLTTQRYERASNMSKDDMAFINALNNMAVNELKQLDMSQNSIVIQVLDRKNMITKYDVAMIKRTIEFSPETSHSISDGFKQFVAANQTVEAMEKNAAKAGYQVRELPSVTTSSGGIQGVNNSKEALRWVFNSDTKKGDISEVITCGNNQDELIVMALTDIYPKGYMPLSNPQVNQMVRQEVMNDKKAELIMQKLNGVKSVAEAQQKGAKLLDLNQITLASPAFVTELQAQEPALSGAVAATEKGKFSSHPVKGNAAVYTFLVKERRQLEGKFNNMQYQSKTAQRYLNMIGQTFQNELMKSAQLTDNRYLFM